jgi:hypothetical protein
MRMTAVVWLLVASLTAQGIFLPSAGRDRPVSSGRQNEEESSPRQQPVQEEVGEEMGLDAPRPARFASSSRGSKAFNSLSPCHRPASYGRGFHRPAEMIRRNGVGSLLRC